MDRTFSAFWMQSPRDRTWTSATHRFKMGGNCVVLVVFLFSCSSLPHAYRETPIVDERASPLRYSIVCIIHGDGDYLYHDSLGNAHRADEEALARATTVAERNPQAEVFIFHEKHRKHSLLFFPLHDGKFSYYRNGKLIAKESYWRDQGPSRFDPEVELFNKYCQKNGLPFRTDEKPELVRLFLYFGHEIPEFESSGYDASYRDRTFTVHDLAKGLKRITHDSPKFDLIVLSTCFSGTPHTIGSLAPFARYIIASPENLHLSYFDMQPFERLDLGLQDGDVSVFAKEFARHAFDRLTTEIQTSVTVALYNVDLVQGYVRTVDSVYDHDLTILKDEASANLEHCDCAENPSYMLPGMSEGVDVFYQPPRFGRTKHKQDHSGWECWRGRESGASVSHSISEVRW